MKSNSYLPLQKKNEPMKITFRINYRTVWGQRVAIIGSIPTLGNWEKKQALMLHHLADGEWEATIHLNKTTARFEYKYVLLNDQSEELDIDWGKNRTVNFSKKQKNILLKDCWRSKHHGETAFYTSAFSEAIFKAGLFKSKRSISKVGKINLRFQIHAPRIAAGQRICLLGNIPEIGKLGFDKTHFIGK